jgi:hypothetical protein
MPALSVRTSSNEEFGNLGSGLVGDAAASSRKHFMSEQELAVAAMHVAITHVQVIALGLGRNATVLRTHVVFIENVVQLHSCFLGAGVILRSRLGISGLTSAATIWVMAAAGIVIGAGYGGAGLALSLLILALITVIALTICSDIVKGLPCFPSERDRHHRENRGPRLTRVSVRKPTGFSFRVRSIPTIAPRPG